MAITLQSIARSLLSEHQKSHSTKSRMAMYKWGQEKTVSVPAGIPIGYVIIMEKKS